MRQPMDPAGVEFAGRVDGLSGGRPNRLLEFGYTRGYRHFTSFVYTPG